MPAPKEIRREARAAAHTAWAATSPWGAFSAATRAAVDVAYEAGLKAQILACSPDDLIVVAVDDSWTPEDLRGFAKALDLEPGRPRIIAVQRADATRVPNGQLAYQAGEEAATARLRARFIKMLDQGPWGRS